MKKSLISMATVLAMMTSVAVLPVNAAANPEASKKIIHRESWDSSYLTVQNNKKAEHKTTCTAIVYEDNIVEISCQNYDSVYSEAEIDFGSVTYNDSLYANPVYVNTSFIEYDSPTKINSYIFAFDSYDDTNKIISFSYRNNSIVNPGKTILLKLRPIEPFDEKTDIVAFGHTITVNADGTVKQDDTAFFGDINGDGFINAKDATCILRYSAYVGTGGNKSLKEYVETNKP